MVQKLIEKKYIMYPLSIYFFITTAIGGVCTGVFL